MKELIQDWIGENVSLTLRAAMPVELKGKLVQANGYGVLLELEKGRTFIPVTSILHITTIEQDS